jgi:hypothetical protein
MSRGLSKTAALSLANQLMDSDGAIIGMIVVDKKGKALAYSSRTKKGIKGGFGSEETKRVGIVEYMALGLAPRPGQDTGPSEYVMFVYEKNKILVTELPRFGVIIGAMLTRSSNAEFILNRVLTKFK